MSSRPKQKSNVALLTEGAAYIRRAKKTRQEQVEEIKFDDEARREWLTGFSKRKKAKAEDKRARAVERDKKAHLDERRKARQELREKAAENMKNVRRAMGLDEVGSDEGEEDDETDPRAGPSSRKAEEVEEAEFSDEDQLATVTITEDFDPTSVQPTFRAHSASASPAPEAEPQDQPKARRAVPLLPPSSGRAQKARERKKKEKKEEKPKKSTSMETASERRKGRIFEAQRRTKKASMAMERDGRSRGLAKGAKGKGAKGKTGKGRK